MQEYIQFAILHWELSLALIVTLLMLLWNIFGDQIRGIESISPQQAIQLINRGNPLILDVREPKELVSLGSIGNSKHVPLISIKAKIDSLESDKSRAVLVVCRNGSRSNIACGRIKKSGFVKVYNLKGGLGAWQNAGLPLKANKS